MSERQSDSVAGSRCFACSPDNPVGLQIPFHLEGDLCIGFFTPGENHVGYDNVVHGGLLFTALDDVMANWLYLQSVQAYTGKASIRYRREARVGERLRLEGQCVRRRSRMVQLEGRAFVDGSDTLVCEADATFMLVTV